MVCALSCVRGWFEVSGVRVVSEVDAGSVVVSRLGYSYVDGVELTEHFLAIQAVAGVSKLAASRRST